MTLNRPVVCSLLIPSVLLMTGCSPYIYKEEVSKFQGGVEQASQMLDSQEELLSKSSLEINRSDLIENGSPRLVVPDKCVDAITCIDAVSFSRPLVIANCANQFKEPSAIKIDSEELYKAAYKSALNSCGVNAKSGLKVEISTQLSMQKKVLAALSRYSNALTGIVNANDKKVLSEAASKACSSTQQLYSKASSVEFSDKEKSEEEKAVVSERVEKDGKAITAVCGLVTEIGTSILDQQRAKVLTRVVNGADSRVSLLATYLANESRKVNSIVLRNELVLLTDSVEATVELQGKDEEYLKLVDSAVTQKNKFMGILKANPEAVFLSMAEAHKKLKEAVNDPKTQLDTAIESIERFNQFAKEAHEAIKALSEKDEAK